MGSPFIFSGSNAKSLKQNLDLNGVVTIQSGAVDPSLNATDGTKGSMYMSTLTGAHYVKNDAGFTTNWTKLGLINGKNYFATSNANPDFESNTTTPWAPCSATFTNGVPGTPTLNSGSFTLATNGAAPLSGTRDMAVTKPASNCQGSGFISGVLTIDREDQAKMLYMTCSYACSNTNFDASGSSTESFEWWIYDAANAQMIQPSGYRGMTQNSGPSKLLLSFQTPSNATQFRVVCLTNQTSTLGFAVEFDSFALGPQTIATGAAMTDPVAYVPTITGFGTVTNLTAYSQRFGSMLRGQVSFTTGTTTAVAAQVTLGYAGANANVTMDVSKLSTANSSVIGSAAIGAAAAQQYVPVSPLSNQNFFYIGIQSSGAAGLLGANGSALVGGAGVAVSIFYEVPIVGWSSNVQQSSDSDQRIYATSAYLTANQTCPTASPSIIQFGSVDFDTSGSYNNSTYTYTCTASGYFDISTVITVQGVTSSFLYGFIYKNGAQYCRAQLTTTSGADQSLTIKRTILCKAGDTISFYIQGSTALVLESGSLWTYFNINRLSGSAVVQATEAIRARYTTAGGNAIGTGATTLAFASKTYDSHGAYNTTTGLYTCLVSGEFQAYAYVQPTTAITGTGSYLNVNLYKNGSQYSELYTVYGNGVISNRVGGTDKVYCNAGDTLAISANAGAANTANGSSYIWFARTGN